RSDDVLRFSDRQQATGYTNAEINRQLSILKRGYVLATEAVPPKLLSLPKIKKLDEDNARQGFFERDQFETVRGFLTPPLQPLVTFAYLTGWRIRSWRQVDFKAGMVRLEVGTTKNKGARLFPFNVLPELRELLEQQRAITTAYQNAHTCKIPHVFHRDGKPI